MPLTLPRRLPLFHESQMNVVTGAIGESSNSLSVFLFTVRGLLWKRGAVVSNSNAPRLFRLCAIVLTFVCSCQHIAGVGGGSEIESLLCFSGRSSLTGEASSCCCQSLCSLQLYCHRSLRLLQLLHPSGDAPLKSRDLYDVLRK
jgi:hypothetical protein